MVFCMKYFSEKLFLCNFYVKAKLLFCVKLFSEKLVLCACRPLPT